jgi:hypothetical protein
VAARRGLPVEEVAPAAMLAAQAASGRSDQTESGTSQRQSESGRSGGADA